MAKGNSNQKEGVREVGGLFNRMVSSSDWTMQR